MDQRKRMTKCCWSVLLLTLWVGAPLVWAQPAPATTQTPAPLLQADDLIAICGDSITEQKEYSVLIQDYLLMCASGPKVQTAQFGWAGDSMGWLLGRRGDRDILMLKPTVVTTCYGMNDGNYAPVNPQTIQFYQDGMTRLMHSFKQGGVRVVVVGSPGCVDSDTFRGDPQQAATYNQTLAALRDAARQVAQEQGFPFANVHDPMVEVMAKAKAKYGKAYHLAGGDGVHPARNGQLVMAYAFLKAMGCDGDIGTITLDLASGQATAAGAHQILASSASMIEIESSRYPFCFYGKPEDPNATSGVIEFFPFNQDLNRFRLIVRGAAPGQRLKVTWGQASKEFTAADLEQGINLAAEFPVDNPFVEPFRKVEQAVRAQQEYETTLYKGFLANVTGMEEALRDAGDPQAEDALARIRNAMFQRRAKLADASAAAVAPVKHTIKVEVVQ